MIIADLTSKGLKVLTPLSEHLPFDLVVFSEETDKFYKVQCKYKSSIKSVLRLDLRSSYSTSKGCSSKRYKDGSFDVFAVYSPEINMCLYIDEKMLRGNTCFNISHKDTKSKVTNSHLDYLEFPF